MLCAAAALLALPALAGRQKKGDHGPIPWLTSLPKARKAAASKKKPIMVDFYAEWCPPCKEMMSGTYKDKAVVARAKRFVPALIDIDKQAKEADSAKVEAVPTIVFYNHKGKEVLRAEGYRDAKALLDLMAQAEKKAKG
jgi:thiol:disulfide interchange protein